MNQRSNAEWVQAIAADGPAQEAALADLGNLLRRAAMSYIRGRLAGAPAIADDEIEAMAQDCSQDASLLVMERLPSFRGEAQFTTWAASFAIRLTMTALRRRLWRDL